MSKRPLTPRKAEKAPKAREGEQPSDPNAEWIAKHYRWRSQRRRPSEDSAAQIADRDF